MTYLKQFTVFPSNNADIPHFYLGLLMVKQASQLYPYAWVDNIRKSGKLSVTLTPCSTDIHVGSVQRMLDNLTGRRGATLVDLKVFLNAEAARKRATGDLRTMAQAYRPCVATPELLHSWFHAEDDPLLPPTVDSSLTPVAAGTWSWEKWTSPPDLYLLLEQWLTTKYPKSLHKISNTEVAPIDKRRTASARTTLTYLLEQIRAWDAQQTHYIEHPHPLLSYTAESFARLPQEQQTQLMADCQTWFSVNMLIGIGTHEGEVTEGWDNEDEKHYMYATRYAVEDGKVVDTEHLIAASADDLADYLQSLNG